MVTLVKNEYTFDLVCYCDSYPGIGNGHLKRSFDIIESLLLRDKTLKISIMGKFSETAEKFIELFNSYNVSVLNASNNNLLSKVTLLDTMYKPGDVDTIETGIAKYLKRISDKLFVINTGFNTQVPEAVDAIINYIPLTRYYGNNHLEKYFGFKYVPVTREFTSKGKKNPKIDLLCIIGGSEIQEGPRILSETLNEVFGSNKIVTMILSPHYPLSDISNLKDSFPFINYKKNVPSIKKYMEKSECIICTYGNTTYESLTLHKPTFIAAYYDFQHQFSRYLEKEGVAVSIGNFENFEYQKLALLNKDSVLNKLEDKCKNTFTESGIENISKVLWDSINNV